MYRHVSWHFNNHFAIIIVVVVVRCFVINKRKLNNMFSIGISFTGDIKQVDPIMSTSSVQENRVSRWYFGGVASSGAACFTHPLDLLKVTLQTQQQSKLSAIQLTKKIISERGILSLYNGLSASLLRQITYSTTRFGLYEVGKQDFGQTFLGKVMLAGVSGAAGGNVPNVNDMFSIFISLIFLFYLDHKYKMI